MMTRRSCVCPNAFLAQEDADDVAAQVRADADLLAEGLLPLKYASSMSAPMMQTLAPISWSSAVRKRPRRICQPVASR